MTRALRGGHFDFSEKQIRRWGKRPRRVADAFVVSGWFRQEAISKDTSDEAGVRLVLSEEGLTFWIVSVRRHGEVTEKPHATLRDAHQHVCYVLSKAMERLRDRDAFDRIYDAINRHDALRAIRAWRDLQSVVDVKDLGLRVRVRRIRQAQPLG